ncbi:NAD(P)-binding protein [Punctularia strigosozonata HHB-11173 SS5]|uniref:NAD(P)-binding protein n=1 Tax=Punctularia strigosozonata (strain HHB-11173) TaxID=741275 RepID=UPI00044183A9|nr:NAD(P)-binding protein [Punctularia strigosozonata HHB-11173 SS5]EIN11757.1 NAD(P)-binding protein [Punctularia strigosozonata HHB-11173 SS5]
MTTIPDEKLYAFADRVKGVVVLITGAGNGIGKAAAVEFAKRGAKVAIGDINAQTAKSAAEEIVQAGGEAIGQPCDVTQWGDQVALFQAAHRQFGSVDIVIANAGISEVGTLGQLEFDSDGRPLPPNTKTLDVNITGVAYTTHLGLYYMKQSKSQVKALVLIGSMASWQAVSGGPLYSASKHGVLGLARSLYPDARSAGIRTAIIHPWFAATGIIQGQDDLLSGLPLTPVSRIAGAIFYASTDRDWRTSGCVWMLPDERMLLLLERERLTEGVYRLIDEKIKRQLREQSAKSKL